MRKNIKKILLFLIIIFLISIVIIICLNKKQNTYTENDDYKKKENIQVENNEHTESKEIIESKNEKLIEYAKNSLNMTDEIIKKQLIDFDNDGIYELCVAKESVDSGVLSTFYTINNSFEVIELNNILDGELERSNGFYENYIFAISEMYVVKNINTSEIENYIVSHWQEGFHAETLTLYSVKKENENLLLTEVFSAQCDEEAEEKRAQLSQDSINEYERVTDELYVPHKLSYEINGQKVDYPYELFNELKEKYRIIDGGVYNLQVN